MKIRTSNLLFLQFKIIFISTIIDILFDATGNKKLKLSSKSFVRFRSNRIMVLKKGELREGKRWVHLKCENRHLKRESKTTYFVEATRV